MSARSSKTPSEPVSEADVKAALKQLLTKQRERGVVERLMPFREEIIDALQGGVTYKELYALFTEKGVISTTYSHFCDALRRFKARVGMPEEKKAVGTGEGGSLEERRRQHAAASTVTDFSRRALERAGSEGIK